MSGNGIIISGNGGDTKPPRKFPPLCWSQEEALVLIQAYRDRWHALRRGCLRTADWDAVAEDVGRICPGATPPKTSAQCRHKMEKLRQRYRVEKQREMSFGGGGQFVSNWFYFEAMESLERNDEIEVVGSGSGYSGSGYSGLNPGPGRGIRFKPIAVSMGSLSNNSNVRVSSYVTQGEDNDNDEDNDEEFEDGYYETPINKNLGKTQTYAPRYRELDHLGARPRKVMKTSYGYWNGNEEERGSGYGERNGRSFAGYGESEKRGVKRSNDDDDDDDDDDDNDNDVDDDPLGKLVSSIKVLADGFVKMEKMKMDMVREIETMRMEAEMKRNEMLLESQRQMIAAFVKGLAENKK